MKWILDYWYLFKFYCGFNLSARERGFLGESIAVKFLRREKKLKIIKRNWRSRANYDRGEIDIIGQQRDLTVFIEVKTRQEGSLTPGYYAVSAKKKKILAKTCRLFIKESPRIIQRYCFHIIEVRLCKERTFRVMCYENIPLFDK